VLDPPTGTWQEEGARFWTYASTHPESPKGVRVVCLDDGTETTFGISPAEYEIHGSAYRLTALFTGNTVFGEDLLSGKLYGVGSLKHTAELTGRSLSFMMGR
jgi:hypothetical protein